MSILYINTGTSPNAGNGDVLRTAFWKVNQNFAYLSTVTSTATITVSTINSASQYANTVTNVTGLRFDEDSGFDVEDLGGGNVKVMMNSTFKYWNVDGNPGLVAEGLDTVNFITGNGINIVTATSGTNKSITFEVTATSGFTGSLGGIGYTGSQGAGFTGSQGAGFTGSQGLIGYVGSTGAGFTGSQGNPGPSGPGGGPIGYTGSQGDLGYVGSIGYSGSQGSIGFTGSQGDIGFTGSQGAIGYVGSIGFIGSQGLQGPSGGPIGFTGSQGIQGPIGVTGFTGSFGNTGFDGSIGFVGSKGFTGSFGNQGPIGNIGPIGPQGNQGPIGNIGPSGGPIGFTGSQGIQGPSGGPLGPQGFTGSQGEGFIGSIGFTGSVGGVGPGADLSTITNQTLFTNSNVTFYVVTGTHRIYGEEFEANFGPPGIAGYSFVDLGYDTGLFSPSDDVVDILARSGTVIRFQGDILPEGFTAYVVPYGSVLPNITLKHQLGSVDRIWTQFWVNTASFQILNIGNNIAITTQTGNLKLAVSNNTWTFSNTGTIILPAGGDIVDSVGNSVLGSNYTNIASHVIPAADLTYDLGTTSSQWRSLYVGTSTIYLGGTSLSVSGGNLTVDGSPVTGAANLGDWGFNTNTQYILGGGVINNGDLSHGATASLVIPENGSTTTDLSLINTYGTIRLISGSFPVSHIWTFGSDGSLTFPSGGVITETAVTNSELGTTTTGITITPLPVLGGDPNQSLYIYPTEGEGNHLHLTAGDQTSTDLYLGNDSQYVAVRGGGAIDVRGRNGAISPSTGTSAGSGSDINIYAGWAGSNDGRPGDGAAAGSVYLAAGVSSTGTGGIIQIASGDGPQGYGDVEISTDGNNTRWKFNRFNTLELPGWSYIVSAINNNAGLKLLDSVNGDRAQLSALGPINLRTDSANTGTEWIFGADGSLTFPTGGDITFDSSASSYISGVTGIEFVDGTTQTTAILIGYTGSSGAGNGFTGSSGDVGFVGSTGFTGSQGIQGSIGPTGFTGSQGFDGSRGFTGSQGNIGPIGPIGLLGYIGSQGIQGPIGFIGSRGIQGFDGSVGYTGSYGNIGPIGPLGYTGSTGEQGPIGPSGGPIGPVGYTGSNGTNGVFSPYSDIFTITNTTSATSTVTGALQVSGGIAVGANLYVRGTSTIDGVLKINDGAHETFSVVTTASTTATYNCSNGQIFYHNSTGTVANWTANLINLSLESGYATSVSIIINQGNTGYYPNAVQIGGVAQILNWQGNSNPTPSTGRTDVVTFSIVLNSSTYLVLGQLTGF